MLGGPCAPDRRSPLITTPIAPLSASLNSWNEQRQG
jgi:hypothetical protein